MSDTFLDRTGHRASELHGMSLGELLDTNDMQSTYAPVVEAQGSGDFMIGGKLWPGLSKLIEEAGEVIQVAGKLMGSAGNTAHWSGDLRQMLHEEISDLYAALDFFSERNGLDEIAIGTRRLEKWERFEKWHREALASRP